MSDKSCCCKSRVVNNPCSTAYLYIITFIGVFIWQTIINQLAEDQGSIGNHVATMQLEFKKKRGVDINIIADRMKRTFSMRRKFIKENPLVHSIVEKFTVFKDAYWVSTLHTSIYMSIVIVQRKRFNNYSRIIVYSTQ